MLTYADVCRRMPPYADVQVSSRALLSNTARSPQSWRAGKALGNLQGLQVLRKGGSTRVLGQASCQARLEGMQQILPGTLWWGR